MSYDIQIWSVDPVPLPDALREQEKWRRGGSSWVRGGRAWQIVVGSSVNVLAEDVPEAVASLVPGIRFLAELNLEPRRAPRSAYKLLNRVSRRLGKLAHGVVFDPQTDVATTPAGVRRYRPRRRPERFAILVLSWWFTDGPLLTEQGLDAFLSLLERHLPEAMPRRYGLFEPPQHQYEETGRAHFASFLQAHRDDVVVWYPHRPVVQVSAQATRDWGPARPGFRTNTVRLGVEANALEQPGWPTALARFWRAASRLIRPFYGDVRTLGGFVPMGGTYGSDMETDFHPVKGPWWTGIPRRLGHAAVLGAPYLALWPSFEEMAQRASGLAWLSTDDWTAAAEVSDLIEGVPEDLAQRRTPAWSVMPRGGWAISWNTEYPPVWPFDTGKPG